MSIGGYDSRGALRIAGCGLAALGTAIALLPGPVPFWAIATLTGGAALALRAGGPLGSYVLSSARCWRCRRWCS